MVLQKAWLLVKKINEKNKGVKKFITTFLNNFVLKGNLTSLGGAKLLVEPQH
jgi:hypothetical protein